MALAELQELNDKLKKLLETRFIRTSMSHGGTKFIYTHERWLVKNVYPKYTSISIGLQVKKKISPA